MIAAYTFVPVEAPPSQYLPVEMPTIINISTVPTYGPSNSNDPFNSKEIKFSKDPTFQPLHGCCDPQNIIFGAAAQADICKCDPDECRKNGTCCPGCPGEDMCEHETTTDTNPSTVITTNTQLPLQAPNAPSLIVNYSNGILGHSCCA